MSRPTATTPGPLLVSVPVFGPEPIGAASQDALDAEIGLHVSNPDVIAPGFWPTSDATYIQPVSFTTQGTIKSQPVATNGEFVPLGTGAGSLPPAWST